jgi:hypothetical protein
MEPDNLAVDTVPTLIPVSGVVQQSAGHFVGVDPKTWATSFHATEPQNLLLLQDRAGKALVSITPKGVVTIDPECDLSQVSTLDPMFLHLLREVVCRAINENWTEQPPEMKLAHAILAGDEKAIWPLFDALLEKRGNIPE